MDPTNVELVTLSEMRIASAWAFGQSPENAAWQRLEGWAKPKGLMQTTGAAQPRIFGFNNPNPSEEDPDYGYELWLTVPPDIRPEGDIRIETFSGGLYARMPITVVDPGSDIPAGWELLYTLMGEQGRELASHQWLEEHHLSGGGNLIALYCPLKG